MRRLVEWGETAHVFLGAALALPPTFLVAAFVLTSQRLPPTAANVVLVLALAVLAIVGIVAVACAPPVRTVEIATARSLLGLDLPDPVTTRDLAPRLLGAAWCAIVALVGGSVLIALLYLAPLGVGLVAFPFTGEEVFVLPGNIGPYAVGSGGSAAWLLLPGIASLLLAVACVAGGGRLLRRLAPRFLGPTDADRIEQALTRERETARANALARDLHDSVGHALTAMTLQACAARVTLHRDPEATLRAITAIEDTGRAAVGELDAMLGMLRGHLTDPDEGDPEWRARLAGVIDQARCDGSRVRCHDLGDLAPGLGSEVTRIVQEGLTNAAKHGSGPAELTLGRDHTQIWVDVSNPLRPAPRRIDPHDGPSAGGRGLLGLRERALLAGGTVEAGPTEDRWRLLVRLPLDGLPVRRAQPEAPVEGERAESRSSR